jgi:hypothetical protein
MRDLHSLAAASMVIALGEWVARDAASGNARGLIPFVVAPLAPVLASPDPMAVPPLAYCKNGAELPPEPGAPLRLTVARQLGYESLKFLTRLAVTDTEEAIGDGLGPPAAGYSWYAGS